MMDERRALEHICARLIERFPDVPAAIVQHTVREVHARFDGRVRDYVPVLVEREARARLATIAVSPS
ncbi:MAG: three-helix bundle dimerization domain-containing protein [Cellulomonas sp.]